MANNTSQRYSLTNSVQAALSLLIASIMLSFSGLIVRSIDSAGPWQINIYRNMAFIFVIWVIFSIRYRGEVRSAVSRTKLSTVYAALSLTVAGIAIVHAFLNTTVANTVFTLSATPIVAMIFGYIFLGERLSRATVITILVALIGIAFMFGSSVGLGNSFGNFMALVTVFGFAGFAVICRAYRQDELLPALFLAGVFVIIVSTVFAFRNLSISTHDLILCIIWGAGLSGIAHWIFVLAAQHLAAAELTMFSFIETALAPIWVWYFIGENPGVWAVVGGFFIVISLVSHTIYTRRDGAGRT